MEFEWDETKARANEKKHHVSFLEAAEVFGDEYCSCVHDPDHSYDEERYLLFGVGTAGSDQGKTLIYKEKIQKEGLYSDLEAPFWGQKDGFKVTLKIFA